MKKIYQFLFIVGILPANLAAQQYFQSFDSNTMPLDWTVINEGDTEQWKPHIAGVWPASDTTHSGSHSLGLGYSRTANDDYAISPAIVVTAGVSDKLSFWATSGSGGGLTEIFDVKISTTTPTADAFTDIVEEGITPTWREWTKYTYDLSAYIGQTIYIAFYSSTTNLLFIGIDDFEISSNTLGVSEAAVNKASVYPNPVADILHIKNKNTMSEITVYDLSGKIVKKENPNSDRAEINVSSLATGNYLVKIKDKVAEQTYKIIKK